MKKIAFNDYFFFIEAWTLLHVTRGFILFLPFKKMAAFLGNSQIETTRDSIANRIALDVSNAVTRAARFTIHSSKCYDQALSAKLMLTYRKVSSTIYFGLAKDHDSGLSAHAWVRVGNIIVTGKRAMSKFTPVAWFGS